MTKDKISLYTHDSGCARAKYTLKKVHVYCLEEKNIIKGEKTNMKNSNKTIQNYVNLGFLSLITHFFTHTDQPLNLNTKYKLPP